MALKMMSMLNKTEIKIYPIRFDEDDAYNVLMDEICEVTKYISKDSFLGIQIEHHRGGSCYAFSDRNGLKGEEIEWLFHRESASGKAKTAGFCNLFEDRRKVYAVRYKDENTAGPYINFDSIMNVKDLCRLAKREDLIVRLVFCPGEADEGSQVLVLLSIPRKISMKGQVYFGNRYPKFILEEVTPDSRPAGVRLGIVRNEIRMYLQSVAGGDSEGNLSQDDEPAWVDNISSEYFGDPDDDPYEEQLKALIGLSEVKKQVEKIMALAKLKKDAQTRKGSKDIPIVLNMVFAGNPGTAKTTVARIFAGLLKDAGLLESSEIIEVGRADLVGKYVGHTADRVKNVFGSAKGKLLFIDEAYSLLDSREGNYGDEAINTMVQEMENNRDQTIVILAGYPGKMKEFLERNPGLRSRVPFQINFADYSADEMVQIAEKEAAARGFCIEADAKCRIREISENVRKDKATGNGRFCRNLVENAIMNYALRVYGEKEVVDEKLKDYVLIGTDFEDARIVDEDKPEAVIGFRV